MATIIKQDLIELVNQAITLLTTDSDKALRSLHPYIPVNGPVSVDYGIYTLQYALIFGENIQQAKTDASKSLPLTIGNLFADCKLKNFSEYLKMLTWISYEMKQVHEQMKRARVNLLIDSALYESFSKLATFDPSEVNKLILSLQLLNPGHHLLANAYKDMYEINFFLELLANLILISKGEKFSNDPYKSLSVDGKLLKDKGGRLIKGNVINWLTKYLDTLMSEVIVNSYNNKLRNIIGGHNDYIFDSTSETYLSNDGKLKFTYNQVFGYLSNLELLFSALRLDGLIRFYNDGVHPAKISEIGYMDWTFSKDKNKVFIAQYWSNFGQNKTGIPKTLSFYRLPYKRDGKYISLSFNKKYIYPYDLRVIANDQSIELMKSFLDKDKIQISILSVVPEVAPFTNLSKTSIILDGKSLLVINDLSGEIEIDKPSLKTLIDYLEA